MATKVRQPVGLRNTQEPEWAEEDDETPDENPTDEGADIDEDAV